MIKLEEKLLEFLGKNKYSPSTLRRQMKNQLCASDVDNLLQRLVAEKVLIFENGCYSRCFDSRDASNWEQA